MQNHWIKLLALLTLYISCTGFSYEEETTIPARQEKDECVELKSGATLSYQFTSTISVKFDIHRHVTEDKTIVLDKAAGTKKRGPKTVKIKEDGIYCLNWKNRYREDLKLNYQIQFKNPTP